MLRLILALVPAWAAAISAPVMAETHHALADEARVVAISSEEWCAADLAQDLDAKMALLTDDAVLIMPGREPIEGLEAIRSWQAQSYAMVNHNCVDQVRIDEALIDGDLAIVRGRFAGRVAFKDGSREFDQAGYFVNVLARDAAGEWRVARQIFTY